MLPAPGEPYLPPPGYAGEPAATEQCYGVLYRDRYGLHLGGGVGEDEGICVIGKSEKRKVLATCRIGYFCRVIGKMDACQDSGECVEVRSVVSARMR